MRANLSKVGSVELEQRGRRVEEKDGSRLSVVLVLVPSNGEAWRGSCLQQ
jgi:hypothetical protein